MKRELWALREVPKSEFIVSMHDYWVDEEKGKSYLVIDYVKGGTVKDMIERSPDGRLPVDQVRCYFYCLIKGLMFLHQNGIFHRDIKTDNVMVISESEAKITDFGTAVGDISTEGVGAPAFQPPEVAKDGKAPSSAKLDIWAAGITLYFMATGMHPFFSEEEITVYQMFEEIAKCQYSIPPYVHPDIAELIRGMLDPDPDHRWDLQTIAAHKFLQFNSSELDKTRRPLLRSFLSRPFSRKKT